MPEAAKGILIGATGAVVASAVIALASWGAGGDLIERLGGLTEKSLKDDKFLARLRGDPGPQGPEGPPGARFSVPVGAVVAFDLESGGCPDESWEVFAAANDKFIVGSGVRFKVPNYQENITTYDIGGKAQKKIEIKHLPSHKHGLVDDGHTHLVQPADHGANQGHPKHGHFSVQSSDRRHVKFRMDSSVLTHSESNIRIKNEGDGIPLDILPPYVALTYCKKIREKPV